MANQAHVASIPPRILLALVVAGSACANTPIDYGQIDSGAAETSTPPPSDDAGTPDTGSNDHPTFDAGPEEDTSVPPPPPFDAGPPIPLPFHVSDQYIPSGYMGAGQPAIDGIKMSNAQADCKTPRPPGASGDCYSVSWNI